MNTKQINKSIDNPIAFNPDIIFKMNEYYQWHIDLKESSVSYITAFTNLAEYELYVSNEVIS